MCLSVQPFGYCKLLIRFVFVRQDASSLSWRRSFKLVCCRNLMTTLLEYVYCWSLFESGKILVAPISLKTVPWLSLLPLNQLRQELTWQTHMMIRRDSLTDDLSVCVYCSQMIPTWNFVSKVNFESLVLTSIQFLASAFSKVRSHESIWFKAGVVFLSWLYLFVCLSLIRELV